MAKPQDLFAYTNEQLTRLEQSLSTERLTPYLFLADGDKEHAIKLYEWNIALSESFYGVLQGLEIAVRNVVHRTMCSALGLDDWYDHIWLDDEQRKTVQKAKGRIERDGKQVTPGKVVAELTFGFWVSLTGPTYAQTLWDKHLHRCFIRKMGRKAAHRRLDLIRKFRNRVAHHESILGRSLKDDYTLIVEAVHWICPVTAEWVKSTNSFHERFLKMPENKKQAQAKAAQPPK